MQLVSKTALLCLTKRTMCHGRLVLSDMLKIEADDQAIQTILLGLPEDIYAVVDSCETAQEIWLQVQQMMKGSDIGIQEKKANLFNEWEGFTSNDGESIKSYYHRFLKLMNDLKRNKHFPEKIASNLKFLNNLQPEWSRHVTIVHQTKDLHTIDYTQLYDFLKYNQKEVDELKAERLNGLIGVPGNANHNLNGNGNRVAVRAEGNGAGNNGNQIRCYNYRGVGHFARTALLDQGEGMMLTFRLNGSAVVIQICLWCVDPGCSKHMTRNLKLLINFVWKFLGTVRFENDHVAVILGFDDLQWGNILITRVYFVEGLGHNLFSVGQFCDSDLEVAFRRNACFVRNLEGVNLLKEDRSTNLYTINLHDMASASPICLMAHASSTKSWLWHQRLSHLNFDTINDLAKNDLVSGLLKFKCHKEHLCPSCEQRKSKRASHPPKPVPNSRQRLHLLHMDLCGPMRIASINGKRYVLVIVDDYSRYTWVHFLRSKDEAPEVIKTFLKRIIVLLQVVERRNRMLVEAARTMLIFSRAPLFLWVEAIATVCFTQNHSIIHRRFNKTPYELINGRKPDICFLHVFRALCYPKNDREDIRKLGVKGDIGFFIGYSADSCAYIIFNRRTKEIMETMNVSFDEVLAMAFEQRSSKLGLQSMTSGQISSGLNLTYGPSTITTQPPCEGELDLLFEAMYDDFIGGLPSAAQRTVPAAQAQQVRQTSTTSTSIADTAPTPTKSSYQATNFPISSQDVDKLNFQQHVQQKGNQASLQPETVADNVSNAMFDGNTFVNPFANPSTSAAESSSL
uniref:Retrovirus-related Pol polyprotein from transposon TNT 1-94 n=1 Tax=Tanacetum cinerariifolium TaxID=118510 RepID=A0A6L2LJU6_TANCI|nr:retrovirus-related Pol polyprotein from transposon TNT 1-94 [Tanacetum cinerariifolium]